MVALPQELVHIIVGLVDATDICSLRAFALVSPSFRVASQLILFRALTLKGHVRPGNYLAASRLLTRSPHIGAYVREVTIELPLATYDNAIKGIPTALATLTAVQRCIIDGGTGDQFVWNYLLCEAIVEFVSRQPLRYLHLCAVKAIPLPAFIQLATSSPALFFSSVALQDTTAQNPPPARLLLITELSLDNGTGDISTLLSHEGHAPPLRHLSVHYGLATLPLIIGAARSLEYMRFGSPATEIDPISIPPLPSLRSFEIEVDFDQHAAPWVRDALAAILRSKLNPPGGAVLASPSCPLEEITITYLPVWESPPPSSSAYIEFLAQLDRTLSSLARTPRLRWRLRFVGTGREVRFARLVGFIAEHMPQMDALDRLVFETYEPKKWNGEFL
ncbi:hypothetical protein MVEN_00289100 [Mycena venus]|uniref:F-box domain-containing protein n=1 Tax=Mycena venus TaxID=2733690 RepID=A0A8H6Z282_9AGAR|nr:hypothetical protein MVEN_00289100 [Mycena venus]